MNIEIEIEQFDNGISIRSKDVDDGNESATVALEGNEECSIGKEIWADVKHMMDANITNVVKIKLEYVPVDFKAK